MPAPNILSLPQELAPWHEFYGLLGTASATLIGLLFVAASVGAPAFSSSRRAALRMFLSASVVHFSGILSVSLLVLAPITSRQAFGLMILCCGLFGLLYYAVAWRDTVRDGLHAVIEFDDHCWYAILPAIGYLVETAAGAMLARQEAWGCAGLAISVSVLLIVGIHNAWDITLWSLTRRMSRPENPASDK